MSMLRLQRWMFRLVRAVFRASGLNRIRVGNSLLYAPIRRSLYRFLWKVSAPDPDIPMEVQGHQICGIGPNRGATNGMGILMDSYEEDSTRMFKELTQPDTTVIDIGAHIGYYTLLAARGVGPSGRVYAFEPEVANYRWLLRNIEINGYENVTAISKAVADKTGPLKLWLGSGSGTHSIYPAPRDDQKNELVEATTIDDFLEAEGWPAIEVVKMDAEGAEPQVFKGMQRLLERQDSLKIIFEFNRCGLVDIGHDPLEFLQSLQALKLTLHSLGSKQTRALSSEDILSLSRTSMGNRNLLARKATNEN